jgi:hypothetical protein
MKQEKITSLTVAQEKQLRDTYREYLAVGRSIEPINKEAAIKVVNEMYRRIGKPAPVVMVFSSPMMCILAWRVLQSLLKQSESKPATVRELVSTRDQLGDQLWAQLWAQLRAQLGDQLGAQLWNYFGGQHWVYWQSFYKFCQQIGVRYTDEQSKLLDLWIDEGRSLHWWFPYEGIVLLSERHTQIHVDDRGRLHCENGLACGYSDGWGIYSWHGVRVPESIILHPELITLELINKETNAEIRRAMVERYGLDRLKDQGQLIHRDSLKGNFPQYISTGDKREFLGYVPGEETISLYELPVENAEGRKAKVIHVTCPSTLRDYVLGVDADHTKAIEAVASTFNLTEQQYREAVCAHS